MSNTVPAYTIADLRRAVGGVHREMRYDGVVITGNLLRHTTIHQDIGKVLYSHCMSTPTDNCFPYTKTLSCRRCLVAKLKSMMAEIETREENNDE